MITLLLSVLLCLQSQPPPIRPIPEPIVKPQSVKYIIDSHSDIRLDSKPCSFSDVPDTAKIINIDLAADGKTILRLWFRSKGK